jgi:uncharacterized protein YggE
MLLIVGVLHEAPQPGASPPDYGRPGMSLPALPAAFFSHVREGGGKMFARGRIILTAAAVVLVAGSGFAGVKVGQKDAPAPDDGKARAAVEARLAALEALRAELAGGKQQLAGLDHQLAGLQKTIESDARSVTVTGEAYLPSSMRVVTLGIEVEVNRKSVEEAVLRSRNLTTKVTSAVRSAGISAEDVRTSWGGTYPDWNNKGRYTSSARVLVTIRNVERIDQVLKAADAVSQKEIGFGSLTVSDEADESALGDARREALVEARERAEQYAKAIERKLGQVLTVSEQVSPESSPATPEGEAYYRPSFIVVVGVVYELA